MRTHEKRRSHRAGRRSPPTRCRPTRRSRTARYAWDATTLVLVEATAGGRTGLGYSYADTVDRDADPRRARRGRRGAATRWRCPGAWSAMVAAIRNLGRPGIASMAISAVDAALWDLKARLLELPLVTLLGAVREAAPVYGSGGFTSYSIGAAPRPARRLGRRGHPAGQDEDRPRPRATTSTGSEPPARRSGRDAELFVDANGAYGRKQALRHGRSVRRAGRELVRGAGLLRRPRRAAAAPRPRARPAWTSPPASTATTCSTSAGCSRPGPSTCSRPTRRRCGGITGFLRVGGLVRGACLPLSAHCAPSLHAAPGLLRCRPSGTSSTSTTTTGSSTCSSTARRRP